MAYDADTSDDYIIWNTLDISLYNGVILIVLG